MSFINKDFLLQSGPTHRLYHDYAIDSLLQHEMSL